jgi:hypothetical protein
MLHNCQKDQDPALKVQKKYNHSSTAYRRAHIQVDLYVRTRDGQVPEIIVNKTSEVCIILSLATVLVVHIFLPSLIILSGVTRTL